MCNSKNYVSNELIKRKKMRYTVYTNNYQYGNELRC